MANWTLSQKRGNNRHEYTLRKGVFPPIADIRFDSGDTAKAYADLIVKALNQTDPKKGEGGTIGGERDINPVSEKDVYFKNQLHELLLRIDNGEIVELGGVMSFIKGLLR